MKVVLLFLLFFLMTPETGLSQTIDSLGVAKEVDSLLQVTQTLLKKQRYEEALQVVEIAKSKVESVFGKNHIWYINCLHHYGNVLYYIKLPAETESVYLEALSIVDNLLGKENTYYADILNTIARFYCKIGKYRESEERFLESKAIYEKIMETDGINYAICLNGFGVLYRMMGNLDKAESIYLIAKDIWEKLTGKESNGYAEITANLANIYFEKELYEKAELFYTEAGEIFAKVRGKEHTSYAAILECLGNLYHKNCDYDRAESFYLESKSIFESVFGKEHIEYAPSLESLANLYRSMGRFGEAEILYLDSRAIYEKVLGKENPEYGWCLNNIASLYWQMGNDDKSEVYYKEAMSIIEKALGVEHPRYGWCANNLANLYNRKGAYNKAEIYYLKSQAAFEKSLGEEHTDYAMILNNLAVLYQKMKAYGKSEMLYYKANSIQEKIWGKEHKDYAMSLFNLATLYEDMGNHEKALPLFLESKAIVERILGKEHPEYVENLHSLALYYWQSEEPEKSDALFIQSSELSQLLLSRSVNHLTEIELYQYLRGYVNKLDQMFSYSQNAAREFNPAKLNMSDVCYDNILFFKGFIINSVVYINRLALSDSIIAEKLDLLKLYHRRLAVQYALPIAERDSVNIARLEEKTNALEKELVRTVAGFDDALRQVRWREVQARLKPEEAAIEFIHYQYYTPKKSDSLMYAALVLRPGDTHPQLVALFEERALDSLLQLHKDRRADYVNDLYTFAERGIINPDKPTKSLFELLWQPLEKYLAGVKIIYFSPSGLLHRFNFDAIPVSPDSVLADRYRLIEIGSTRQLVIPSPDVFHNQTALLYGGVQYQMDSATLARVDMIGLENVASRDRVSFSPPDSAHRGDNWYYLPGSAREVDTISRIMRIAGMPFVVRKGYSASEESFKQIGQDEPSPRVLHLATHGFFFPDPKDTTLNDRRLMAGRNDPAFKISDHPMIRSGLLLAGANHAWNTGKPVKAGMEDGILTAYEISQMNLSATELVVLSACETGLGDIEGNEGVYGLQRAFKIAGAKYLLMSLWKVQDRETARLMTAFYRNWLERKMEIPVAFKAAQQEMREAGLGPYYWAGFVLVE
ncbi:MAG: CHAT domain-containing protein [Haliscomenobacteraceae bacterium CHB4]|nr:hypothetical protein [Saprospiraceae bacterium]MCE7925440.1 CHAT domain-containing protein [Haliscomenobacteraceae bacterium CHB4]